MRHPRSVSILPDDQPRKLTTDDLGPKAVSCRVYFRDRAGGEHGVYVNAVNRYHAFAVALRQLASCQWSKPEYNGLEKLQIEVLDDKPPSGRRSPRIVVTKEEFEAWLNRAVPAGGDRLRDHIKMLLGRMPPDRDFQRGIQAH
jgi:hypothetical protein